MGYTPQLVAPLIGLGTSAISDSWYAFVQNEKTIEAYEDRVKKSELPIFRGHKLSPQDLILRRHVLNLMTRFETSWDDSKLYVPFLDSLNLRLSELQSDGLISLTNNNCKITDEGRPFMRNVCMAFDAHLAKDGSGQQLFSKTI
jgi:oxygen-independent coproporphyrinogen-3 oxidase